MEHLANNRLVNWAMHNYKIVFLMAVFCITAGIYSLVNMPKQEYPTVTVREGLVVGLYPGASPKQVEEKLTKPLENYLFRYKEVNRRKTYSYSKDGIVYVYVELEESVKDMDQAWSKIRHGLIDFKQTLSPDIQAIVVDDDFGDTSALLLTLDSKTKNYRQLGKYMEQLEDRLRTVESVSRVESFGELKEQITVNLDKRKMASYNIPVDALSLDIFTGGLVNDAGAVKSSREVIPIHLKNSVNTIPDLLEKIVYTGPDGNSVRLKDIATVKKEYPRTEGYIEYNGTRSLLLSVEMRDKNDIVHFGRQVKKEIEAFKKELPPDVQLHTVTDQPEVVSQSVTSFLIEMLIAICSVIIVTILLLPFRVAGVAATSIPITIFISLTILYISGFELNIVNFAALMVVLGLIVDDCIVIVDAYLDYLDEGYSRWNASIMSAKEYFKSLVTATLAISITFFPFLFTFNGGLGDFILSFPWTVSITLFVSLGVAVILIPIIQYFLIRKGLHVKGKKKRKTFLDLVQSFYNRVLPCFFKHSGWVFGAVALSFVLAVVMVNHSQMRMMPLAERNMFAVEIYLPDGASLNRTRHVADSLRVLLEKDKRVTSVTSFIGTSSPRFHTLYAPKIPSDSYAQFIVDTKSNEATNEIVKEDADKYSNYFPDAYVYFKQMDNESTEVPVEIRLSGADDGMLKEYARRIEHDLRRIDGLTWIRDDYGNARPSMEVDRNSVEASRAGVSDGMIARELENEYGGITVGNIWESDYNIPVKLKGLVPDTAVMPLYNTYVPSMTGHALPLRQVADIHPDWHGSQLARRDGVPTLTVQASLKQGRNVNDLFPAVKRVVDKVNTQLHSPDIQIHYGGMKESDAETIPQIVVGLTISLFIIFAILLFHYKKISLALLTLASTTLCFFGAALGIYSSGLEFGITSVLGVVCLFGIIVRNSVILFDYAEMLRRERRMTVKEAAIEAARRRMRPIVLTSLAASTGVIPMLLGHSPLWAPMAAVICIGVLVSMFFILSVLPVSYWLVYRNHDKVLRFRSVRKVIGILLLLLVMVPVSAQQKFTLGDMEKMAATSNLSLKSADVVVEQSRAREKEAFTHYFPSVKSGVTTFYSPQGLLGKDVPKLFGLSSLKTGVMGDVTAVQPLYSGGQITNSNQLAKIGTNSDLLQRDETLRNLYLQIRENFWSLYILREKLKTLAALDSMTSRLYTEVQHTVKAGVTMGNDLLRVKLRRDEITSQRLQLDDGIKNCKSLLNQLMGRKDDDFDIILPPASELSPADEYVDHELAVQNTNSYRLLENNVEAAKFKEKIELGKLLPSVGIGINYGYQNLLPGNHFSLTVFATVSIPLSDWWGGSHALSRRKQAVTLAEYQKEDTSRKMVIQMNTLKNELNECYQQWKLSQSSIASASENLRLNTNYYSNGLTKMSDLLESQVLYQQAMDKKAESYARYMMKSAEYQNVTGR
ncbi:MAG: efflux RND transporter permease subunit [Prevotella sp.]|jgi:multidrug efflux pump subunit AcrB/outer membrane protein TolC|nr:efflux RND transporter permease subunit [Prevotella sp.]